MIDIDLVVRALRENGHRVEDVVSVPDNAGEYELTVDGNVLSLAETRQLLERDEQKK